MDRFELRLHGTGVPNGDLTFTALHRITGAMQLLATRIGRGLTGQEGPGRSLASVERDTTLRLRGELRQGSTILDVAVGGDQLFDEGGLEHRTVDQLFELLTGLAAGTPPPGTTPQIGSAVIQVVEALDFSADRCEFTSQGRRQIAISPSAITRSAWPSEGTEHLKRVESVVTGWLDLVDLRRARFRLRDAVGNDITLNEVVDSDEAAHLVGQQVTAVGDGAVGARGQISSVTGARISAAAAISWASPTLNLIAASAPPTGGIPGVTDEDVEAFLALIRE